MRRVHKFAATLIMVTVGVVLLGASGDTVRFNQLGRQRIICVCGCNQMLLECNHVGCTYSDKMRQELAAAVQTEPNDDAILQSFVREYGTTVLAAPGARGFDRMAWIMPFLVFFGATFGAAMLIRNWRERQPAAATPNDLPALDPYREQARRETEL